MPTYRELQTQIAKLQAQAEEIRKKERVAVIAEVKQKIADYQLLPEELDLLPPVPPEASEASKVEKKSPRAPVAAKYQNPRTGQTWSGRGKPPKWIAGKNKDKFLIS